jgi:CDP-glycerol glycerophosphotransferase (TagB/SpsB family)
MREFFDEFKNSFSLKSTRILDQGADLQKVLAESSLFITDYSSVAWDFLYLDRPVLFYQFDIDKYIEKTGAYIDMKKDLFGPAAYDAGSAAEWVRYFVENDYSTELFREKMEAGKKYAFAYLDGNNCSRISAVIKKCLQDRRKAARLAG